MPIYLSDLITRVDNILGDYPEFTHWDDTADGTTTVFKLKKHIVKNTEVVKVNSVTKTRDSDYTIDVSPGTIIFTTAPDGSPQPPIDVDAYITDFSWLAKRQGINDALSRCHYITADISNTTANNDYDYPLPASTKKVWRIEIADTSNAYTFTPWRRGFDYDNPAKPTSIRLKSQPDYPRTMKLWVSRGFAALTNPTDQLSTSFPTDEDALNYLALSGALNAIQNKLVERHIFDKVPLGSEDVATKSSDMRALYTQKLSELNLLERKILNLIKPQTQEYTQVK